jgi:hypothetical protein
VLVVLFMASSVPATMVARKPDSDTACDGIFFLLV